MTGNYVGDPLTFLIQTLFHLYILAVMLRFLLQLVRADFYNPICQFLVRVTHPPLAPLRRLLPSIGRADTASIVLMLMLQFIALALVVVIAGRSINAGFLLVYSVAELVNLLLNVFLFTVLIRVILSWINPGSHHPAVDLLHSLTEPLLGPARRLIPPIGGLDLSPIAVLIGIQVVKMLVVPPLQQMAFAVG